VPVGLLLGLGLAAKAMGSEPDRSEPAPYEPPERPPAPAPLAAEKVPVAS
jgi:hypothetical protein